MTWQRRHTIGAATGHSTVDLWLSIRRKARTINRQMVLAQVLSERIKRYVDWAMVPGHR